MLEYTEVILKHQVNQEWRQHWSLENKDPTQEKVKGILQQLYTKPRNQSVRNVGYEKDFLRKVKWVTISDVNIKTPNKM